MRQSLSLRRHTEPPPPTDSIAVTRKDESGSRESASLAPLEPRLERYGQKSHQQPGRIAGFWAGPPGNHYLCRVVVVTV